MAGSMKLSVIMITYNHEQYIAEAIEHVLGQITSFDFELVIGEDCGQDNTRNICEEYAQKYPNKVRLLPSEKNLGMHHNFLRTYHACEGEFVAICEGDDYWSDSNKLQLQVDFLEANPDYVLCSHNGIIIDEIGTGQKNNMLNQAKEDFDFSTADLIEKNRAATLTVVFRNNMIKTFPEWFTKFGGSDRLLYLLLSQHGKLRHLDYFGAVYRLHSGGVSIHRKVKDDKLRNIAMLKELKSQLVFLDTVNHFFELQYDGIVLEQKRRIYVRMFLLHFSLNQYAEANALIKDGNVGWSRMTSLKDKLKYFLVLVAKK